MHLLAELLDTDDGVVGRVYGRELPDDPYVRVAVVHDGEEVGGIDMEPLAVTVLREALAVADDEGREAAT